MVDLKNKSDLEGTMSLFRWAMTIFGGVLTSLMAYAIISINSQVANATSNISALKTELAVLNTNLASLSSDRYTAVQAHSDKMILLSRIDALEKQNNDLYSRLKELETLVRNK